MKLQTQIKLQSFNHPFGYEDTFLLLGSCFSQNIGDKLSQYKLRTVINPFGILFHPIAIEKVISSSLNGVTFTKDDIFNRDGIWSSFLAHSSLNGLNAQEAMSNLNHASKTLKRSLIESNYIIITLGTSWVYRNIDSGEIVANCHKVSQKQFSKELLSLEMITESLGNSLEAILAFNSKSHVIFTISPVRHLKDGFIENTRSKAHLFTAVQKLAEENNQVSYFPSYEIMMDELRDYRFYKKDMVHPSDQAIEYIWQRFIESHASLSTKKVIEKVSTILSRKNHMPFNPKSEAHDKFKAQLDKDIVEIQKEYPFIEF